MFFLKQISCRQRAIARVGQYRLFRAKQGKFVQGNSNIIKPLASRDILKDFGRIINEKTENEFERLAEVMSKTRTRMLEIDNLLTFWNSDDVEEILVRLEEALILADFGPKTSTRIIDSIRPEVLSGRLRTGDEARTALKQVITKVFRNKGGNYDINLGVGDIGVILVVGVNGGGKTTTIGKLAFKFVKQGASVLLAPGDTFRAAATEQLAVWAERSGASMGAVLNLDDPSKILRPDAVFQRDFGHGH